MNTESHQPAAARGIMLVLIFLAPMTGIGIDLYAPSLPYIAATFHVTPGAAAQTITIYLIGYGLAQPFYGVWSDTRGRKKPLVWALLLYFLSSLAAIFAPNWTVLMGMRLLQGIAVAAVSTIIKGIAVDVYNGKRLQSLSNFLLAAWAVGPIIAPVIGSYLQAYAGGWRSNFCFLAGYGLVALILCQTLLPETNFQRRDFTLKVFYENYRSIFRNKIFILTITNMLLLYTLFVAFSIIMPFLVQTTWGYSTVVYGYIALIIGAAYFLGNFSNQLFIQYYESFSIIRVGAIALASIAFVFLISAAWLPRSILITTALLFLMIYLSGIVYPNHLSTCLSMFPHIAGSASAVLGCFVLTGTGLLSALISLLGAKTSVALAGIYLVIILIYSGILFKINRRDSGIDTA